MTSLRGVEAASRPSARTRQTASRPVKTPASLPVSPVTSTDPGLAVPHALARFHHRIRFIHDERPLIQDDI